MAQIEIGVALKTVKKGVPVKTVFLISTFTLDTLTLEDFVNGRMRSKHVKCANACKRRFQRAYTRRASREKFLG